MRYYKIRQQINVRIVADEDIDLVPSHWVDVTATEAHKESNKPNVKFNRPKPKPKAVKKEVKKKDK